MANTYSQSYYHLVFSTKNRVDFIRPEIENRVWAYIGGIARNNGFTALQVGGIDNHVHALLSIRPSILNSKAVQLLKDVPWVKTPRLHSGCRYAAKSEGIYGENLLSRNGCRLA